MYARGDAPEDDGEAESSPPMPSPLTSPPALRPPWFNLAKRRRSKKLLEFKLLRETFRGGRRERRRVGGGNDIFRGERGMEARVGTHQHQQQCHDTRRFWLRRPWHQNQSMIDVQFTSGVFCESLIQPPKHTNLSSKERPTVFML